MAVVDLESDIVKKGDGLARLPQSCFTFKMALKFKPVVVTAVLVWVLFLMSKRVTGLRDSCACVLAFLEFCFHEYFFKGMPSFVLCSGRVFGNVLKQWLLCYKMPAVHEYCF